MKRKDTVLMAFLCLISAMFLLFYFFSSFGETVTVYKDGKIVSSWNLKEDRELSLDTMKVKCHDKKVWVENSTCRDKICENTGKISKGGSSIICAPQHIVIEISGGKADAEI